MEEEVAEMLRSYDTAEQELMADLLDMEEDTGSDGEDEDREVLQESKV